MLINDQSAGSVRTFHAEADAPAADISASDCFEQLTRYLDQADVSEVCEILAYVGDRAMMADVCNVRDRWLTTIDDTPRLTVVILPQDVANGVEIDIVARCGA